MIRYIFFLCSIICAQPTAAVADDLFEPQRRAAIITEAYGLLESGSFATLEEVADEYRTQKSRTPAGHWKSGSLYEGLKHVFDTDKRDDDHWAAAEKVATDWVTRYPDSPTAHLYYAQVLRNRAWSYRGGSYADKVRPEDWPPFFEYIEKARIYLEEHKSIADQDPRWYQMMVEVAIAQNWKEARFRNLLDEGLSKAPDYYPLYFAAVDYYSPRWGGSASEIEAFAREAVERTRDTEGWSLYARIYWHVSGTEFGDDLFAKSDVNWDDMKKGFDDIVRRFPDAWNIGNFAKFACLKRDREKTGALIDLLGEGNSWPVWMNYADFDACKALAAG